MVIKLLKMEEHRGAKGICEPCIRTQTGVSILMQTNYSKSLSTY